MPGLSTGEFDGVILSDAPGPVANLDFALHELFAITSKYTSRSFQETASVESEFHRGLLLRPSDQQGGKGTKVCMWRWSQQSVEQKGGRIGGLKKGGEGW